MQTATALLAVLTLSVSLTAQVVVTPSVGYLETFEAGSSGPWMNATGAGGTIWQYGMPAAGTINSAASGSNVMMTDLVGQYVNNTSAGLEAQFDFTAFAGMPDPIFAMNLWYETESGFDGVNVEIDTGTGFTVLGAVGTGTNWYNDASVNNTLLGNGPGWAGSSAGYLAVSHQLTGAAGTTTTIRINFGTDASVIGGDGAAVDDIQIFDAPVSQYPGTFEDLTAFVDVNLGGQVEVIPGSDVYQIQVGSFVAYTGISPNGTFTGVGDLLCIGSTNVGQPLPLLFPGLWLEPTTAFVINGGVPGIPTLLPPTGFSFAFAHPGGSLSGLSLYVQTLVSTGAALNGIFAGTNAVELQLQ